MRAKKTENKFKNILSICLVKIVASLNNIYFMQKEKVNKK